MQCRPFMRAAAVAVAAGSGDRSLTSLDLLLCMVPISFFLSIVSLV